jgi:hypothetical protein
LERLIIEEEETLLDQFRETGNFIIPRTIIQTVSKEEFINASVEHKRKTRVEEIREISRIALTLIERWQTKYEKLKRRKFTG